LKTKPELPRGFRRVPPVCRPLANSGVSISKSAPAPNKALNGEEMDWSAHAKEVMHTAIMRQTSWNLATLTMWCRDGCRCVYCGKYMLESYDTAYFSSEVDHLLPVSRYPELDAVPWNRVLTCSTCNNLKLNWDANQDEIYAAGSTEMDAGRRTLLLDRAQRFVAAKRSGRERLFEQERALIEAILPSVSGATAGG
jgi:5-methylcytosine-specific restriction endonuclease McrA